MGIFGIRVIDKPNQKSINWNRKVGIYGMIFSFHLYILTKWFLFWTTDINGNVEYIRECAHLDGSLFLCLVIFSLITWSKKELPATNITWDKKLLLAVVIIWLNFMHQWHAMKQFVTSDVYIFIYLGLGGVVVLSSWIFIYQEIRKNLFR